MTVYAKCHAPTVGWLTDGREYAVQPAPDGCFCITSDAGGKYQTWWADDCFARWERIERDDTPESVLRSWNTRRETEATFTDDDDGLVEITISEEGGNFVRLSFDGGIYYLSRTMLRAINEAVARHNAADTEQS